MTLLQDSDSYFSQKMRVIDIEGCTDPTRNDRLERVKLRLATSLPPEDDYLDLIVPTQQSDDREDL